MSVKGVQAKLRASGTSVINANNPNTILKPPTIKSLVQSFEKPLPLFKREDPQVNRKELGRWGEERAAEYLHKKGLNIIEHNYRCSIGEMDLIAYHGNTLVFVEIKTRRSLSFGLPAESVTSKKQKKYFKIAQCYMKEKGIKDVNCRFDVVEVMVNSDGSCQFNHIINAF